VKDLVWEVEEEEVGLVEEAEWVVPVMPTVLDKGL
jgi:hypothetical protein